MGIVLRFTGENRDPVSSGYALGNGYRWYLPALMRFNGPDKWSPFGRGGVNPYTYCGCDPINFRDPTGHVLVRLNEFYVPEVEHVHFESNLEIGLRLDKTGHGDWQAMADEANSPPASTPSTSIAAAHASSPGTPVRSPEPVRTPTPARPADPSPAGFGRAGPSTSAGLAEAPPAAAPVTFASLLQEAFSRPLAGLQRHTLATRRTLNLVELFNENRVTAAQLPDYPGMEEASRLLGYQVPYSTIKINANQVLHRPNMTQDVKDHQIALLKAFDEWPSDMES